MDTLPGRSIGSPDEARCSWIELELLVRCAGGRNPECRGDCANRSGFGDTARSAFFFVGRIGTCGAAVGDDSLLGLLDGRGGTAGAFDVLMLMQSNGWP
jgi:hypothetical protein